MLKIVRFQFLFELFDVNSARISSKRKKKKRLKRKAIIKQKVNDR